MKPDRLSILQNALRRIACAGPKSDPQGLASIATAALKDAALEKPFIIEAKVWYSPSCLGNSMFNVVLRDGDSGDVLLSLGDFTPSAWPIRFSRLMHEKMPEHFPERGETLASIWFREVLGIKVTETEVQRKRDLGL